MGGVTRAVEKAGQQPGQALGISRRPSPQPAAPAAETKPGGAPLANDKMPTRPAADFVKDEQAAKRRSRRRGRALLSEARLNPEEGVGQSTLGTGPM
jgi:hypothetical protein